MQIHTGAAILGIWAKFVESPSGCIPGSAPDNGVFCFNVHGYPPFVKHHMQYFIGQISIENTFFLGGVHYFE
jgi:hypothetical protein